ncbi:MAG: hypothetical protein MZU97_11420 [Bacillus subtilis]|nr:hypothetical protein [Bacillus subtilis]
MRPARRNSRIDLAAEDEKYLGIVKDFQTIQNEAFAKYQELSRKAATAIDKEAEIHRVFVDGEERRFEDIKHGYSLMNDEQYEQLLRAMDQSKNMLDQLARDLSESAFNDAKFLSQAILQILENLRDTKNKITALFKTTTSVYAAKKKKIDELSLRPPETAFRPEPVARRPVRPADRRRREGQGQSRPAREPRTRRIEEHHREEDHRRRRPREAHRNRKVHHDVRDRHRQGDVSAQAQPAHERSAHLQIPDRDPQDQGRLLPPRRGGQARLLHAEPVLPELDQPLSRTTPSSSTSRSTRSTTCSPTSSASTSRSRRPASSTSRPPRRSSPTSRSTSS